MADRPTEEPDWAPPDGAQVVEPTSGKKIAGWDPAERPPAQYFNWFWRLVSQWLSYLSGFTGPQTLQMGPSDFAARGGSTMEWSESRVFGSPLNVVGYPSLPLGSRILEVRVRILDGSGDPTPISLFVYRVVDGSATLLDSITSDSSETNQTLAVEDLDETIVSGTTYAIRVNQASGAEVTALFWAEVDYDRPEAP